VRGAGDKGEKKNGRAKSWGRGARESEYEFTELGLSAVHLKD